MRLHPCWWQQGLEAQLTELQEQLAATQKKLAVVAEQAQSESADLHAKEDKLRARITELQAVSSASGCRQHA